MRAWEIIKKDLRLLSRDRRTLAILLALPLIFITILGGTTGKLLGWKEENQLLKIAVVDESQTPLSKALIADLKANAGLSLIPAEREEAKKMAANGQVTVAIFIGPGFADRVDELRLSDLLNPTKGKLNNGLDFLEMTFDYQDSFSGTGAVVSQLVVLPTLRVITPIVAKKNAFTRGVVERSEQEQAASGGPPTRPSSTGPKKNHDVVYREVVPSYTVMFVFFLINIMSRSFISEREMGTLRRLRIAPVPSWALLIGKTIPFFIVSLVQSVLLFGFGRLIFGMSWGDHPWLLIPIIVCTSMAATSMGLLVSTVVRTEQQVSAYSNFIVITMAGISGCFVPRDWLPHFMQLISLGTPHAYALMAYHSALSIDVVDFDVVYKCCAMLVVFALAFFCLGWWRFRYMD